MTKGLGEMLVGPLLDILNFGGQNNSPTGTLAIPLADNTTPVYSNSFPNARGYTFDWEIKLGGTGTKAVKVELEQSNQRPVTEGATDAAWVVPDNKSSSPMYASIADTNTHHTAYAPDASAFSRLKFTGLTGNDASTTVTVARRMGIKTV